MLLTDLKNTIENLNYYNAKTNNYERGWGLLRKYQERIKEEVKLWMFLPCDSHGALLTKPIYDSNKDEIIFEANFASYEKGLKKVLFKDVNTKIHFKNVIHVYINDILMVTIDCLSDKILFEPLFIEDIIDLCNGEVELTENGSKYFEI